MRTRIAIAGLVLATALAWWLPRHVLPYSIIKPFPRIAVPPDWKSLGVEARPFLVTSRDGFPLAGYVVVAPGGNPQASVVLIHGISDTKESLAGVAADWARKGLAVILIDLRAHGTSGGSYTTYGAKETDDLIRVLAELRPPEPVAIYGHSLGAAVAIQTMAAAPRLACGILESPFADLPEVVGIYQANLFRLPLPWITAVALERAGEIAGFDPQQVRPELAARTVRHPVWVAHGTADEKIPLAVGRRVYDALPGPGKVWVPIAGGDHDHPARAGGETYAARRTAFLLGCLGLR